MTAAAVQQAYALLRDGRPDQALALTAPLVRGAHADRAALAAHASALKALGRRDEALEFNRRAARDFPASGVAWHNLGATLQDLTRNAEAKEALERAFAAGLDAPETWLVYAHALTGLHDLDGAERAFGEARRRRPGDAAIAQEYARLLWMRTGDWRAAVRPLHEARAAGASGPGLTYFEARILEVAGRRDELHALFEAALARDPTDLSALRGLAQACLQAEKLEAAEAAAERALVLAPQDPGVLVEAAAVRLARGRGEAALELARRASELAPLDQATWGWLATASRALDGDEYRRLYDYDAFVRDYVIATPAGWPSLEAYLAELAQVLRGLHVLKAEPSDQTLRRGTQTLTDLTRHEHPALKALFAAVQAPIAAYLAELGTGPDPLRSRNTGRAAIHSAWSNLLQPEGFHTDHFHPAGWLSSAFYVGVPEAALDRDTREGWIRFGRPPSPTVPPMPAERYVRPEPGKLVLFPSYMWHGTVPFTTPESRLTVAFDILPAA